MTRKDKWGNPVSHGSAAAVARLERAIELFAAYQADPVVELDATLAEHPDLVMGHALRAALMATSSDKAFAGEMTKSLAAAEALASGANERERGHIAAVRAWADGDLERAVEHWGRTAIAFPRDLPAIQLAHLGDFYLAYSHMLRDRVARILPHWTAGVPGHGFVLGMHAFGLEESGDYGRAEETGRRAIALNGQDGWAVHAVAHVMEMQGRAAEGVRFLEDGAAAWAPGSMFAFHVWWHLALFHLDTGNVAAALRLYDEKISAGGFGQALELIDGSALLWRLRMLGHDVGGRWTDLADKWASRVEDCHYVFNDVHAMMAFIGAGRTAERRATLVAVERAASGQGTNAMMAREIGLPAVRGLDAFERGSYAEAIDHLLPVRGKANRFGGSHAQRDMFSWTLTEAAIRMGDRALADAMIAERLTLKPASAINLAWQARAKGLAMPSAA